MELKGSKTEANLWKAFAGESMARNKYTYFASKAKKEGFEQIAAILDVYKRQVRRGVRSGAALRSGAGSPGAALQRA